MLTLFTVPTSTVYLADVGSFSSSVFTDLLPLGAMVVGLIIGGLLVSKILSATIAGAKKVTGGGRRRRR